MSWDASSDLASTLVAVAPSPPSSGLSLTVTAGAGAVFPAPPFDVLIQDAAVWPTRTTAELARVQSISTDTLTLVTGSRGSHGTSARTVLVGDRISAVFTAEQLQAVQAAIDANTTALAAKAPLASPALTGSPTAPTQSPGDNTTKIASTAFVLANAGGGGGADIRASASLPAGTTTLHMSGSQTVLAALTLAGNAVLGFDTAIAGSVAEIAVTQPASGGPLTLSLLQAGLQNQVVDLDPTPGNTTVVVVRFTAATVYYAYVIASFAVIPPASTAPSQAVLTVTPTSHAAALTWTVASNGGSPILDSVIQYRQTGAGGWTTFPHTALGSAGAITVTGLTNGQSYDFQVAPVNAIGQAAFSTVQTATPILNVAGLVGNGAWYAQATLEADTPGAVAGWADSGAHGRDLVGASGALTSVLADGAGINGLKAMHFATSRLEYVGGSPWITGPNLIVIMCRRILANSVNAAGMVLLDATQTNDFDNTTQRHPRRAGQFGIEPHRATRRRPAGRRDAPNERHRVRGVPHLRRRELHAPDQRCAGRADREHRQLQHREDRAGHTLVQWGGTEPDDHAGRARAAGQRPGVDERPRRLRGGPDARRWPLVSTAIVGRSRAASIVARRISPLGPWDLLPEGHRVRGINLNTYPTPLDGSGPAGHPVAVSDYWRTWDWNGTITPLLDACASYGFNACRFFLPTASRYPASGYLPQLDTQLFLNRLRDLIRAAAARGMRSYPCLCVESQMFSNVMPFLPPLAWVIGEYTTICRHLNRYANLVLGVDLCNEQGGWATTSGNGQYVYRAVKAAAPKLTFTWSSSNPLGPQPAGAFDHMDGHVYSTGLPADWQASTLAANGRPFLIGEYGQTFGTGDRPTRYGQVAAMVNHTDSAGRRVAGAMAWDSTNGWADSDWGVLNPDLSVRSDVQAIIQGSPA